MLIKVLKQPMMNRVLYSLVPIILFAIYLFGWRVLAVVIVSNIAAYLTEFLFIRGKKGAKVSMAVFVTGTLLALTLPPSIPLWIAAVGSIVAVSFGKMVFGGFGTNMFNPAILGRTFVYVSFPQQMTVEWLNSWALSDFPGGFARWGSQLNMRTGATILSGMRLGNGQIIPSWNTITGFEAGSIGETSAVLLLLAAIYLTLTKTAKWIPMLSTTLAIVVSNMVFYPTNNPLLLLCTGGAMFGIVYMVTDPVSQPKTNIGLWIYGILTGFLTVFIRRFSLFAEGFMFALLIVNAMMPIIEYGLQKSPLKARS